MTSVRRDASDFLRIYYFSVFYYTTSGIEKKDGSTAPAVFFWHYDSLLIDGAESPINYQDRNIANWIVVVNTSGNTY